MEMCTQCLLAQLQRLSSVKFGNIFKQTVFGFKDYICRENSRQIAIINHLFSVNFHESIFSLFGYMS